MNRRSRCWSKWSGSCPAQPAVSALSGAQRRAPAAACSDGAGSGAPDVTISEISVFRWPTWLCAFGSIGRPASAVQSPDGWSSTSTVVDSSSATYGADWLCGNVAAWTHAVVASVEYRLAPEHPASVFSSTWAATQWLVERAAELGTDQRDVTVMRGGNLAALVALQVAGPASRRPFLAKAGPADLDLSCYRPDPVLPLSPI